VRREISGAHEVVGVAVDAVCGGWGWWWILKIVQPTDGVNDSSDLFPPMPVAMLGMMFFSIASCVTAVDVVHVEVERADGQLKASDPCRG
jgi:hypothetical protein